MPGNGSAEGRANRQVALMASARSRTTIDVEALAQLIHGDAPTLSRRRAAWARVEAELGATDTWKLPARYARTSREDLYLDGLRMGKAAWDDGVRHGHAFFDWLTPRYTLANYSPFGLTTAMFVKMLQLLATPAQQARWLAPALRGRLNGAFVQTELGHGSFVRGLETTATFDAARDAFVLHSPTPASTKFWPGSLAFSASHAVVMARLRTGGRDRGVHAFMVELRDAATGRPPPGLELGDVGPKPSHNQNDNGYAVFDRLAVPRGHLLARHAAVAPDGTYTPAAGFAAALAPQAAYATMTHVRAHLAGVCALQLAAAVAVAARYSIVREQGGLPFANVGAGEGGEMAVVEFKSQHYRLLTALARAYAMLFAARGCRAAHAEAESRGEGGGGGDAGGVHALTAGTKAWASAVAAESAEDARKCCGGAGYLAVSGLPEMVYSLTATCTLEGENYVLWQQTARYLIKWAGRLADAAASKTAAMLPDELAYLVAPYLEICPAEGRQFLDPIVQLGIFQHRSQRLLRASASKFGSASPKQGGKASPAALWNEHMMLLISTARAHIEYFVLSQFVSAAAQVSSPGVKKILTNLCSLFALSSITTPLSGGGGLEFVEDGFLCLAQLNEIRCLENPLLEELLPDLCGLTDAWDFTDAGLGSAIGMKDGNVYERLLSWTRQLPINVQVRNQGGVHEGWEAFIKPALAPKL